MAFRGQLKEDHTNEEEFRKAKDKINGTGRFHVMKNKYGMDGLTFGVKADTSTGHFEVHDYNEDDELVQPAHPVNPHSNIDSFELKQLQKEFFNT